ncbi:zinc metallopeptidase [Oribacterium sp. WCC10]|uniref:zinc metallopeptidase n=1 Tax=Oribacterium sp. WCC10 TaxID=1855343 RepID=UPI0008DF9E1B|nr:zinc metallopeptidase [Oribacterium sp. WCC10]SFG56578.1 hypothetical protein SAMN05216356_11348 [Oribacterium sp. WCC10]
MYGYYGYPMYGYDWTYILVLIGAVISMLASYNVKATFEKFAKVQSFSGLTGAQAAQMILERNGINNVRIQGIAGSLTDNYVPSKKILNLSQSTINSTSIAAIGVAAHECGHAIQDAKGYQPLVLTRTISPMCAIASKISIPLIFFGLIVSMTPLIKIGIIAFAVAISVQLLTLPVEFDASKRAVQTLAEYGMVTDQELSGIKSVLSAAALTYVAAAASSILQLLRLLMIVRGRENRRR